MNLRCFIVDDEQHAINNLVKKVERTPFLSLAGTTTNGFEVLKLASQHAFDLLFLDIQMPGVSGLEILKVIRVPVILTTAHVEYALDGFEHDVIDYLLKPITYPRFLKAAQKAWNLHQAATANTGSKATVKPEKDYFFIKGDHKGKQFKINYADIDYIEGAKNYVIFHCGKAKNIAVMNLKDCEAILPMSSFLRIHNSYIISLDKVTAIEGNRIMLLCTGQSNVIELAIGITYKARLMQQINGD